MAARACFRKVCRELKTPSSQLLQISQHSFPNLGGIVSGIDNITPDLFFAKISYCQVAPYFCKSYKHHNGLRQHGPTLFSICVRIKLTPIKLSRYQVPTPCFSAHRILSQILHGSTCVTATQSRTSPFSRRNSIASDRSGLRRLNPQNMTCQ